MLHRIVAWLTSLTAVLWLVGAIGWSGVGRHADHGIAATEAFETIQWRRTVDGWEPVHTWATNPAGPSGRLSAGSIHPLVVAMLEMLISLWALIAFSPRRPAPKDGDPLGSGGSEGSCTEWAAGGH